jgi:unconventional prefoldin RPB5 interactor 1
MSQTQQVDLEAIEQQFKETVAHHKSNIQKHTTQLEQYNALEETLKTLPHKLSHEIMVPLGSHGMGFMPGKIVHTNEVIILAGAKYFFKTSVHHALGMISRRKQTIKERIKAENTALRQLFNRMGLTQEADHVEAEYNEEEIKEIVEEYNEYEEEVKPVLIKRKRPEPVPKQNDAELDDIFSQLADEEREEDEHESELMEEVAQTHKTMAIDQDLEDEFAKYFSQPKPVVQEKKPEPAPKTVVRTQNSGFTGQIVERNTTNAMNVDEPQQPEPTRKVSKFKQKMMQK